MPRICKFSECSNIVFGGGYCRIHQWKRNDMKTKPIKKRSPRPHTKRVGFGFGNQVEMFKSVYWKSNKPLYCMISGRDITSCINAPINLFLSHCAHVLCKGKYTYWKLNPANIVMLHPEAHTIVDQGTQADRDQHPTWKWGGWDKLVEEKKLEYKQFVKDNQL